MYGWRERFILTVAKFYNMLKKKLTRPQMAIHDVVATLAQTWVAGLNKNVNLCQQLGRERSPPAHLHFMSVKTALIYFRKTKAGALFGSDAASHCVAVGRVLEAKWSWEVNAPGWNTSWPTRITVPHPAAEVDICCALLL